MVEQKDWGKIWRGPFRGAFKKGRFARLVGKPESANPYFDIRARRNNVTFARGFHHAWRDGWNAAWEPYTFPEDKAPDIPCAL